MARVLLLTTTVAGLTEAETREQLKATMLIFVTFMFYFFLLTIDCFPLLIQIQPQMAGRSTTEVAD